MKAYVHAMKFQKWEEPHAHCLIILNDEYRIDTAGSGWANDDSWLMQHDESRCAIYGEWLVHQIVVS